jgi:hypothetical protein
VVELIRSECPSEDCLGCQRQSSSTSGRGFKQAEQPDKIGNHRSTREGEKMRLQSMLLSSQILANSLNCLTSSIHKTPCKTARCSTEKLQLLDIDVHWIVGEVKWNGAIDSGPKTKNLFIEGFSGTLRLFLSKVLALSRLILLDVH